MKKQPQIISDIVSYHFFTTSKKRVNVVTKRTLNKGDIITIDDTSLRIESIIKQEPSKYYKKHTFYEIRHV